jgi:hypothetical protein
LARVTKADVTALDVLRTEEQLAAAVDNWGGWYRLINTLKNIERHLATPEGFLTASGQQMDAGERQRIAGRVQVGQELSENFGRRSRTRPPATAQAEHLEQDRPTAARSRPIISYLRATREALGRCLGTWRTVVLFIGMIVKKRV